jgi:preprotein translocase subunit SecA
VPHQVLNAKQHEREAYVVAQAGRPGAVTVATNMAGRGTDIVLGGNPDSLDIPPEQWQKDHDSVVKQGGLTVLGTEHHESRRIDNQLRGRSGRQGDPGETRFYASMEDEIIKRFGGERAKDLMGKVSGWAGMDKGAPLESGIITKILEGAQSRVEGYHFETRKHLLEFDDVLNQQRDRIYQDRREILQGEDLRASVLRKVEEKIDALLTQHLSGTVVEDRDYRGLIENLRIIFPDMPEAFDNEEKLRKANQGKLEKAMAAHVETTYQQKEEELGTERMRALERLIMLQALDMGWKAQLTDIERVRQGIGLQAYGQRNPLVAYQNRGHQMYKELLDQMRDYVVHGIYRFSLAPADSPTKAMSNGRARNGAQRKMGRNAPCYCGSGKKFKRCHGRG